MSLRESIIRSRAGKNPAAKPTDATPPLPPPPAEPAPLATPPAATPAPTKDGSELPAVVFACGHERVLGKLRQNICPACHVERLKCGAAEARKRAETALRRKRNRHKNALLYSQKKDDGRLPDGSGFDVRYDAAARLWSGTLTVPGATTFSSTSSGVFRLLYALDVSYRTWLAEQRPDKA